ncbi:SOS response-associated peptidase family protein [Paraburkholderia sp. EG287A]|uniref:SOS response-associated peptidase family protein n=1 Tax=Paraburkholderia sp. EG287A TaxID=3237012 RepID=UPI0034D330A3
MCYSALVEADFRQYVKMFGAHLDLAEFERLMRGRLEGSRVKLPKAVDDAFATPATDAEARIKALVDEYNAQQKTQLEQELFKQRARLADAERTLQTKVTKAATESQRIATDKIATVLRRLEDISRTTPKDRDSRIFPGVYAPVLVMEDGKPVIKPMRYQCRIAGKPAAYDVKYPGTYNARRDNLEGFWKPVFGRSHGILLVDVFYENVKRHRMEGRTLREGEAEENVVIEFNPNPSHQMHVACLWSKWSNGKDPDLLSFAAITDEPPPEVVAAGHDRCIVPVKPENVEAWLQPNAANLAAQYALLDDRDRPYYEHRLAA